MTIHRGFCTEQAPPSTTKHHQGGPPNSSGWQWNDNDGAGMGGKTRGVATEAKEGMAKDGEYKCPEYYSNSTSLYAFYDYFVDLNKDRNTEQPNSGLTDFWSK